MRKQQKFTEPSVHRQQFVGSKVCSGFNFSKPWWHRDLEPPQVVALLLLHLELLRQILTAPPAQRGLTRQLFVLTDGQVSNSSACISTARAHNDNARVFSLGVGSAADRHLVKGLARAGQGTSAFASIGEPITGKVVTLLRHALQPCISSVTVDWGLGGDEGAANNIESPQLETKKTLFGYGKPRASPDSQNVRWQAPAKVIYLHICCTFQHNLRCLQSLTGHVCLCIGCFPNQYQTKG